MPVLNEYGDAEYRMEAAVKGIIRKIDPWRLMFGSIACGETWVSPKQPPSQLDY